MVRAYSGQKGLGWNRVVAYYKEAGSLGQKKGHEFSALLKVVIFWPFKRESRDFSTSEKPLA